MPNNPKEAGPETGLRRRATLKSHSSAALHAFDRRIRRQDILFDLLLRGRAVAMRRGDPHVALRHILRNDRHAHGPSWTRVGRRRHRLPLLYGIGSAIIVFHRFVFPVMLQRPYRNRTTAARG